MGDLASLDIRAVSDGRRKSHIGSRLDLDLLKLEPNRTSLHRVKETPRRHVSIQAARLKWRRHIEHQHVITMMCPNARQVLFTYCLRPSQNQLANLRLVAPHPTRFQFSSHQPSKDGRASPLRPWLI